MSHLTEGERFMPTQPMPDLQERLRKQRRWARPPYTPNHLPVGLRLFYAVVSLTWIGWSVVGLLSGHMFFLLSRRGPVHFSGIPAVLFSAAVLMSAFACCVAIVDHYDKRDNESSYKSARRWLWGIAAACLFVSAAVGCAERIDVLPFTDGRVGLLSTTELQTLLASSWLNELLAPRSAELQRWSLILMACCISGALLLTKLGLLKRDAPMGTGVALFVVVILVGPALTSFTLVVLSWLVAGEPASPGLSEEAFRSQLAWLHSMLLACLGSLAVLLLALVALVLRAIGLLPAPDPKHNNAA